ncbi:MAG: aminoglycoside phosphotransferase family protein [Clostridia bacterium]|nr:aminoglycoside phosphotransferase family protein [Clostridia bacterium]
MMKQIYQQFRLDGHVIGCIPFGNGHINRTFLVVTNRARLYILQDMNSDIFKDIPGVMENVAAVCAHLRKKDSDPRHSMTIVPTLAGSTFLEAEGRYWRMFDYVTDGICLDLPETAEDLFQCGAAFGTFQNHLADFPAETLHETIPQFHDTPNRFRQLRQAIAENRSGRLHEVEAEVNALLAYEKQAGYMVGLCAEGRLPLRVTHNDTKLNNVMLDAATRTPLCVMDLDTVMPGLIANDFGEAVRTGASTAAEDETDLSKVSLSLEMYEAYCRGFLGACGKSLTPLEIETLPWGPKLMTIENATRFLADHLNGDVYFHIAREGHNLDRCRAQLALVTDMERKWDEMNRIIRDLTAR